MLRLSRLLSSKLVVLSRAPEPTTLIRCMRRSKMTTSEKRPIAFVSIDKEKERMLLSFRFEDENVKDRLYSINRNLDEALEVALLRTSKNLEIAARKRLKNKKKRKDGEELEPPVFEVRVEDSQGKVLEPFLSNREAFQTGNVLKIGKHSFSVVVNAPTVVRLSLPKVVIAEFPVQAYVTLEHAELKDCEFSWWLTARKYSALDKYPEENIQKMNGMTFLRVEGETSNLFYPSQDDVGKKVMVICEPRRPDSAGVPIREISPSVVTCMTEGEFYDKRHELTKEILPDDKFRVVSYNLLANIYAHTTFSQNNLFGYCPKWALDFDYRKHLLMREILGYNGDLMCFQEVDRSMFSKDLKPCLSLRDFDGIYCEKTGNNSEGVAIFFRESKFELVEKFSMTYSEAIQDLESLRDIKEAVNANETLRLKLKELCQMFMLLVLKHKSTEKHLIVCNTHLYFHPKADHVRLLQTLAGLRLLEETAERFSEGDSECASIFCGDFNSTPEFAVYQLFTTGHVPKTSEDWISYPDEKVHGLEARIKRNMKSACGTPEFTNYTVEFKACLDYIFHSEEIVVDSVVPFPPEEVLAHEKYQAIPSPIFPSDHLALVANLKFRQ